MKRTPQQLVKAKFGSKQALVDALAPLTGDTAADAKKRLLGARNAQLLALHRAAVAVNERFGGKDNLVDAIARQSYPTKGGDDLRAKLRNLSVKRLLDLHRQGQSRRTA